MKIDKSDKEDSIKVSKMAEVTEENVVEKVGDMIRNARAKKKIELPKVSEELCIRKVYLEAIENSDYEAMPEHPYGIGFVRSYAELLGLSSSRMADLYRTELNIKDSQNKVFSQNEADLETSVPGRHYIVISIIAVVLLYFAWLFFDKYTNDLEDYDEEDVIVEVKASSEEFPLQIEDFTTQGTPQVVENSGVIEVFDLSGQNPKNDEDSQIKVDKGVYLVDDTTEQPAEGKNVEVKILKRTWFEAKDEKKIYVSKVFDAGATYKIPEGRGIVVSVGIPSAVEVYIGGKPVKEVFTGRRKTNIELDKFLNQKEH